MEANKAQQNAINHKNGPMLVLAGPGSGKTTVITQRVKFLISDAGVDPKNILVITFTKAAANEMKERFFNLMEGSGAAYRYVTFGTFHAVFYMILKQAYNLSADNIIRDEDRFALIKSVVSKYQLDIEDEKEFLGNILSEIAMVKSERMNLDTYYSSNCSSDAFREIYKDYHKALKSKRLLDFEDMLVYTYNLFTDRKDILTAWQNKFQYILIDEFQDINKIQYDTVRMLATGRQNLFIVGDDDQSIYGFRGSKPEIMLNFHKDYPNAKQVILDVNYRSTPQIVKAAGQVIKYNTKRFPKEISTVREDGPMVVVRRNKDFIDEYNEITDLIRRKAKDGLPYDQMAVLYRSSGGIGSLVRKLMEANVPFRLKDKLPDVFEHWIAKDIFAYIKLARGLGNRNDFLMIANKPKRYIGRDYLNSSEIDLDKLCDMYEEDDKGWMVERINKLQTDLNMISKLNPFAAVTYIRKAVGYDEYLNEYAMNHHIEPDEIFEIVDEIMESTREHNTFLQWEEAISRYKERVNERVGNDDTPRVLLTTMHSSKGLEFDSVFVVDVNEGSIPHKKAILDSDIEEERRMLYVAMTRAKNSLYIYGTMERYNKYTEPSRFLIEAGLADGGRTAASHNGPGASHSGQKNTKTPENITVDDNSGASSKTLRWTKFGKR